MTEASFEKVVRERQFAGVLQTHSESFFRLANTLRAGETRWSKRHYFQLVSESETLESFLDDYGARYNRTYNPFTELVASLRGFSKAGYSLAHLLGRLESYGISGWLSDEEVTAFARSMERSREFIRESIEGLLQAIGEEASGLGLEPTPHSLEDTKSLPVVARRRLPRNTDHDELADEGQKIAEVASRFIQAAQMLSDLGIRCLDDSEKRRQFLASICTEEHARVYEATVHNLQSAYDTFIKNTVIEAGDERLPRLRGHASAALHLLEAVTYLTHFYERHESDSRSDVLCSRLEKLASRERVQEISLNHLLFWAARVLEKGRAVAEDLLPAYTNVQELEVDLGDDIELHARPAALIVGIVNHYGTPVEMEVEGRSCNAGSILELLVTVGSHPNARSFVFRGDENPLRDIRMLFEHGLGESGVENLPSELTYLRT